MQDGILNEICYDLFYNIESLPFDLSMNNFLPYCKSKQDFTLIRRFRIKMNGKQGDESVRYLL